MKKLYQSKDRLILQTETGFGEIAPLTNLNEAKAEALRLLPLENPVPTLASVRFGFDCAQTPLPDEIHLPINAFNQQRDGWPSLKLKVGRLSLDETISLIKQVPKSTLLRLDFNRQWPLEKLLRFADRFSPSDFDYLEEPTASFDDLLIFSRTTQFPIAIDESIDLFPYAQISTLKALVIKPTILGKIPTPPPNVELIFTFAYESPIGILHIARLAQKYNPHRPHGLDLHSYWPKSSIITENGMLHWKGPLQLPENLCLIAAAP